MSEQLAAAAHERGADTMVRARILACGSDGSVLVEWPRPETEASWCDLLTSTDHDPLVLAPGDCVLVWCAAADGDRGVVMGRIGPSHAAAPDAAADDTPDELVIEAKQQLILRVGDGSITIRADGKILIKGKDLVSHAQRANRIRGGSVAIN